jgi:colanic acid/amylovoran biosynthesis glycosyltransferase
VRWPPETFIAWKLEGLAARGVRVTVASRSVFDPDARLRGVELIALPSRPDNARAAARRVARQGLVLLCTAPRRLLKLVCSARRDVPAAHARRRGGTLGILAMCLPLARLRPDVVHFEWHPVAVDYLPLFDVWGCPVTTSCRGSDISVYPHDPGMESYAAGLPAVLRRATTVHCVSASLKREAAEFGLDPAKATVIRPAVDPEVFRPAGDNAGGTRSSDGILRVITVGWLRWEKGHEYALQAIRALLDRGVAAQLEILGGVPEEWQGKSGALERIRHTAADLDLDGHVRLGGHVPPSLVSRRLRASHVLAHAAVTEGVPNAIVEAMACELPVVATRCGGVPEIVRDGVEGLLVEPRAPDEMAQALLALWRDPAARRRMGKAGRARVLSELNLDNEHRAFLAMYREAART